MLIALKTEDGKVAYLFRALGLFGSLLSFSL